MGAEKVGESVHRRTVSCINVFVIVFLKFYGRQRRRVDLTGGAQVITGMLK